MRKPLAIFAVVFVCSLTAVCQDGDQWSSNREFTFVADPAWTTPAKSQGWTGTCWCFSTTSFVETEAKRLTGKEFELSEIYTVYNMYGEKAKRFIRLHGNNNFGQGGLSHDMLYSIPVYGMVRDSDYSGMLPGQERHNHGEMFSLLKSNLDAIVANRRMGPSDQWTEAFNAILNTYIGKIPSDITYDGATMSPVEFARDVLKFDPDQYVEITSYTHMPFYSRVELLIPDNWMRYEGYYNVPLADFLAILDNALTTGNSVVIDVDVSEDTRNRDVGVYYMPHDLQGTVVEQAEREAMFNDWRTTDDHLMHTTGLAKDQDGTKFYYTKDSGGPDRYKFDGFAYLSENYVRAKVLAFLVNKDAIPDEIRSKLNLD
jgi:bleomycin hydrolase